MPHLLVVVPTYNERENVGPLLDRLFLVPVNAAHVLVVDDASPDKTAEVVRERQGRHGADRLHLMVREGGKGGRGGACLAGFAWARERGYSAVCEMDSDLSHDPKDLPRFLDALKEADVVVGSKYVPGGRVDGWEWYRKVLSRGANLYAGFVLRLPIRDYTNGYRCYGPRALAILPELRIEGTGFTVIPQMSYQLYRKGMRFAEIPIVFTNRRAGTSNMSIREIRESFFAILHIRSASLARHFHQTLKFGVTGVLNTLFDLGLLTIFVEVFHVPLRAAVVLASSIAITNAFFLHKYWTFGNKERRHATQYMQFLVVYGSSFLLGIGITLFLTEVVGVWYLFSRIAAIPACALWNYCWMHFGIFRGQEGT